MNTEFRDFLTCKYWYPTKVQATINRAILIAENTGYQMFVKDSMFLKLVTIESLKLFKSHPSFNLFVMYSRCVFAKSSQIK